MEGVVDCISCPVKRVGTFNINEVLDFELMYLHARAHTQPHAHTRMHSTRMHTHMHNLLNTKRYYLES